LIAWISGASSAMVALFASHLLIVTMVVFGNATYFISWRTAKREIDLTKILRNRSSQGFTAAMRESELS